MRRNPVPFLLLLAALARPESAGSATLIVPDAFPTVAAASGSASAGDTILVRSGTYLELVTLVDGVVLRGDDPLDRPVFDGSFSGAVLTATNCGATTRVEDLILRHGAGGTFGGGASLSNADVVFANCRFVDNLASNGAGLGASASDFTLIDCALEGNFASQSGGAIALSGATTPSIQNCLIYNNSAVAGGGIAVLNGAAPSISGCLMDANAADEGAALWWDFFTAGTVQSCTIVQSDCLSVPTGALHLNPFSAPGITANIIAFTSGAGATFTQGGATPTWGCNDAFGNAGGDAFAGGTDLGTNIVADPQFCDAAGGDFTLFDVSPCLAGGGCPRRGAFDVGCTDTAAPEPLAAVSWGRAKSAFR